VLCRRYRIYIAENVTCVVYETLHNEGMNDEAVSRGIVSCCSAVARRQDLGKGGGYVLNRS